MTRPIARVIIREVQCPECGHRWLPRLPKPPARCPKCFSRLDTGGTQ